MGTERNAVNQSSVGLISAACAALSDTAVREVLAFPAAHLASLPVPARFVLQGLGISVPIVWTSEPAPGCREGVVFDAEELRALVSGVQAERLWPADLKGYCLRKLHDSSFRVNEAVALGGAQPVDEKPWTLGRVLRWFDLELECIELAPADGRAAASRSVAA